MNAGRCLAADVFDALHVSLGHTVRVLHEIRSFLRVSLVNFSMMVPLRPAKSCWALTRTATQLPPLTLPWFGCPVH